MTNLRQSYDSLTRLFNQLAALEGVENRLFRDMQTTLPTGGAEDHDREITALSEIAHEKIIDPQVKQWLDDAQKNISALTDEEKANLKAMQREHRLSAGLPVWLAGALTQAASEGERLHGQEKDNGDWSKILPFFEKQLDLQLQQADLLQKELGMATPYDALLDLYSPGWTTAHYDKLFAELEPFLKKLLPQVMAGQSVTLPIHGPFDTKKQEELSREVAERMGFDETRGVLYFIPDHPCAGGTLNDVRASGRPDPDSFLRPLYDMMHELGHGLYDQNTPQKWAFQPAGAALGMDIHESQSLIWEFLVGKSPEFATFLSKRAQEIFSRPADAELGADNTQKTLQKVTPNVVRISMNTSEITYLLHIIMRYRLEKDMINGVLAPKDLPQAWDNMCQDMFGKKPANNAEGCMQDVHWFCGLWGYFPSYAVGYVTAAQLFDAAQKADPQLLTKIENGNLKPLKDWLTENVHSKGSLITAQELIKSATGKDLDIVALKTHLETRYISQARPPKL